MGLRGRFFRTCCNNGRETGVGSGTVYLLRSAPVPLSITPNSDGVAGGTAVTITGYNFQDVVSVRIGDNELGSKVIVDSTTITGVTPAHAAGVVDLVVTDIYGQSGTLSACFAYAGTWTPALTDATSWYEDYPHATWPSLPSLGTSGGAPNATNPGVYPTAGPSLNGHPTVQFDGRTLIVSSITSLLQSNGPNSIVMLARVPSTTPSITYSPSAVPVGPILASDDTTRWTMATAGSAGGTAGPAAWMFFNHDSTGNQYDQFGGIAPVSDNTYHLLVCEWDDGGMRVGAYDLGSYSSVTRPSSDAHWNGFGPKVTGDVNLNFDLATSLVLGGGDAGLSGAGANVTAAIVPSILTFKRKLISDTTTLNNLKAYYNSKYALSM